MQKIEALNPENTTGKAKELLDAVQGKLGTVPNIFKTFAQSPAALEAYLNLSGALSNGALSAQLREQIAVAVAGMNQCDYCASAHTLLGKGAGISEDELSNNLQGNSSDSKTQAALTFIKAVVTKQSKIDASDFEAVKQAGFNDAEIVEIIFHIGMNVLTNYFNNIVKTEIDFPLVNTQKTAV